MKKFLTVLSLIVALPATALAADGADGSCGVGSLIFKGQSGIAPQVLAMTTNGYSSATIGVTLGTSGCSPNATVKSNWKTAMFIDGNKDQLARDMAVGSGETLASLSHLLGVEAKDQAAFNRLAKDNVARIFTTDSVATGQVVAALREALAADATLSHYQAAL
ncbi:MAG: DUF3015 domain-containing protein [Gallionella sp.]|nr:DUF3015 domain-containing protein [Gallionella sp.]